MGCCNYNSFVVSANKSIVNKELGSSFVVCEKCSLKIHVGGGVGGDTEEFVDAFEGGCPCCGETDHLNCECENCSTTYSGLNCIMDLTYESEENTVASFSWNLLLTSLNIYTKWDVDVSELPPFSEFDSDVYDFKVEASYYKGSLYSWSGICHYDCTTEIISRTENGTHSLIYNWAMVGCNSGNFSLYRINEQTEEKQLIYEFNGYTVDGNCIPLYMIDRNGLPKQGETLEMPFNF